MGNLILAAILATYTIPYQQTKTDIPIEYFFSSKNNTPFSLAMLRLLLFAFWTFLCSFPSSSAFVVPNNPSLALTSLKMSTTTKPEIEVVSQPDQEFLEKKGVCKYDFS
eukprot:scaffold15537_cov170-Amphora_coffeaeformis.AAC.8